MALVKFGGGVTQMSGSVGGNTYARNRFGNYIRSRTKPVNPNSTQQGVIRTILSQIAATWQDVLTPAERLAWTTYAAAVAMKNRLGETVYMTGFNHFMRYNSVYLRQSGLVEATGPTTLNLPAKDSTLSMTATVTANSIHVTHDPIAPWTNIPNSKLVMFLGQPQGVTRNFFAGPWKLAGYIGVASPNPMIIVAPYTLILGQKVWAYGRIMTGPTDGRLSEPMVIATVVVA